MEESFLFYIEQSIKENWDRPALTDYKGVNCSYKDVARKIEKLHILFENAGIKRGDKIALCGRNSTNWGIAFLATLSYGAVAVPILNEFKTDNIHNIVNHSEAKLLFVGSVVWEGLNENSMELLEGIISMEDYSLLISRSHSLTEARNRLNEFFGKKYPERFKPENVNYQYDNLKDLAVINYTSGTTSFSKGVMLPYRSLWSNLKFAFGVFGKLPEERVISMLPMAHMYGLAFEFIYEFASGAHIFFLTRTPSPKIIAEAFATIKPNLIISVPLIIEKIIRKKVFPTLEKPIMKLLLNLPLIDKKVKQSIRQKVIDAFGGNFKELIIGGAALNKEVEEFLRSIDFPYTVGYGMTECGPILSYDGWETFKKGSCGKAVPRMQLKIDSSDPAHIVGEILAKGDNLMYGYYKNETATKAAFTPDGWLHTGDLGLIDPDGYLYIKGRSKNMILGPSGQNIYPEEIEDQINNLPYVAESIVIEKEGKLIALIYPDFEAATADHKESEECLTTIMEENRQEVNKTLPAYSQITKVKIYNEEFEKTPKRSIKRYLYQ
ncbi:AMP-binding protein [uncultured Sanguibacteroides sp.]|uniref:AMP-binding protein n=1 Tax=uncultured Sanguibacteroides sp. TaxID=1635151 RepID=UPI0025D790C2|nr:AMP-binding protein [uncultured Sanguibacteroides sp.]